jgi:hypothetical protein
MILPAFQGILVKPFSSAVGDIYWDNVISLLNFDTNLTDAKGLTWSGTGNAAVSGGSLVLDGAGDYISTPSSATLDLGSGDFTIEFKFTSTDTVAYSTFITREYASSPYSQGWDIMLNNGSNDGKIVIYSIDLQNGSTSPMHVSSNGGYNDGNEHDVAWVRSGGDFFLFIDGVVESSVLGQPSYGFTDGVTKVLWIGASPTFSGRDILANIKQVRITKGVGRYTSNYTPISGSYPTS